MQCFSEITIACPSQKEKEEEIEYISLTKDLANVTMEKIWLQKTFLQERTDWDKKLYAKQQNYYVSLLRKLRKSILWKVVNEWYVWDHTILEKPLLIIDTILKGILKFKNHPSVLAKQGRFKNNVTNFCFTGISLKKIQETTLKLNNKKKNLKTLKYQLSCEANSNLFSKLYAMLWDVQLSL